MAHIPGSDALPSQWLNAALAFRQSGVAYTADITYGPQPRNRMDIFHPPSQANGLAVLVHGGYWMKTDKGFWSHLAKGAVDAGWSVALPSYTLTPEVRISSITKEIGLALEAAAEIVEGPVRLIGHSAGGHLVTRMICDDSPLSKPVLDRIKGVVSLSGLHDLRPLLRTAMNETLRLDDDEARTESAICHQPIVPTPVTAWVGGNERPEFIRQSKMLAQIWQNANVHIEPDQHHFSVLDGLASRSSPLVQRLLGA